jgi:hypothetical protein
MSLLYTLVIAMSLRIVQNLYMMYYAINTILFFVIKKMQILRRKNKTLTQFNFLIIGLLMSALILRPFAFVTIDSIIITRLLSDSTNSYLTLQGLWIVIRGLINSPRDLIEVSLISYMLYY